jgi:hypothetical protein
LPCWSLDASGCSLDEDVLDGDQGRAAQVRRAPPALRRCLCSTRALPRDSRLPSRRSGARAAS